MGKINEELIKERENCSFNIQELTNIIDGGPQKTLERKERENLILKTKKMLEAVPEEYLSLKKRYEHAVKLSVYTYGALRNRKIEEKITINNYRDYFGNLMGSDIARDGTPMALHCIMFIPALLYLASEEQKAKWVPRAWNFNIIGTYAQTELAHGSNIRGLETTATYDVTTKEFVLHSPTITSYKWWPGGLAHTTNYCIAVAQLYTKGQCHGIHSFMVQVRDEDTHLPLPGIKIGDIGARMGLNNINNGFVGFDNVRIPRSNMLMKHAQVLEDGTYAKPRDSRLNYIAMLFVRIIIASDVVCHLCKAVTIATRFSAVRHQSRIKDRGPECQILDYLTQQHKIFIGIVTCHALRTTATRLRNMFISVNENMGEGNLDKLPELHALSCCLKSVSTMDASYLVERCRLACGGHGFMLSSNFPFLYELVTAASTYEGENTVLLLQTARFLVNTWQRVPFLSVPVTSTVAYLKTAATESGHNRWDNSVDGIIRGFQLATMRKISACEYNLKRKVTAGVSPAEAWNITSIQLVSAAEAHCRVVIMSTFHEETQKLVATASPPLKIVLKQLVELYVVYWALERLNDLLLYTSISNKDIVELENWYDQLLVDLRPNAVGLVDAFDIKDQILNSTLGAYDGRVYERLMEEALKSPLNAEPVNQSFQKYLKPLMQGKL